MIADLQKLWQEAFHDPEDFTDLFFSKGFSPDRYHCINENGVPVSALYWFDCALAGHKIAYVYGVATLKSHRGKGFAGQLLKQTHEILKIRGYSGAILVPREESLFDFYRSFGYETATTAREFFCEAGNFSVDIRQISPKEYARLRSDFLPGGSVEPNNNMLTFLQTYCKFFAGEDFLLICEATPNGLWAQELLGNAQAAPGILNVLGFPKGRFRTPGTGRDFAMWLPLTENCPRPAWFCLALD